MACVWVGRPSSLSAHPAASRSGGSRCGNGRLDSRSLLMEPLFEDRQTQSLAGKHHHPLALFAD